MEIVFVCTGNTCRSPMAEGFLREKLKEKGQNDVRVSSAGIATVDGLPAAENAVAAMKDYGIDISLHKSRVANEKILCSASLILTMSTAHKDTIRALPKYKDKNIFTLKEYLGVDDHDVKDPFGMSLEIYKKTAGEINDLIIKLIEKIDSK